MILRRCEPILRMTLKRRGFEILQAKDGLEALTVLAEARARST